MREKSFLGHSLPLSGEGGLGTCPQPPPPPLGPALISVVRPGSRKTTPMSYTLKGHISQNEDYIYKIPCCGASVELMEPPLDCQKGKQYALDS